MKRINLLSIKSVLTCVAFFMAFTASAQLTAVLQHESSPQVFYGADAFKEALTAAEAGDQILLSSGNFNAKDIDKSVKIQGTGATYITGGLRLFSNMEISGIRFLYRVSTPNITNVKISNCQFMGDFSSNTSNESISNSTFISCNFEDRCFASYADGSINNYYSNCIFRKASTAPNPFVNSVHSNSVFDNCIIYATNASSGQFKNCIFLNTCPTVETVSFTNVIIPSDATQPHANAQKENITLLTKAEITALFKNTNNYELKEEAAATYLGTDGKQIGVYGGAYPYSLKPAIPTITSSTISHKVEADGKDKLSVSITAETR